MMKPFFNKLITVNVENNYKHTKCHWIYNQIK